MGVRGVKVRQGLDNSAEADPHKFFLLSQGTICSPVVRHFMEDPGKAIISSLSLPWLTKIIDM